MPLAVCVYVYLYVYLYVYVWQRCEAESLTCWIVPSVLQSQQSIHQRLIYLPSSASHSVIQVGKDPF